MKLIVYFVLIPLIALTLFFTFKLNGFNIKKILTYPTQNFIKTNLDKIKVVKKNEALATPIPLKPDNGKKGTYIIGQLKHEGPVYKQVVFDPLDVKRNETLTVTITFDKEVPPENVSAVLETDNKTLDIVFKNTNGIWIGSVKVTDTVLFKYILNITAKGGGKTVKAVVAPRS